MFKKGLIAVLALSILTILTYANMAEAVTYAVEEGLVSYWSLDDWTVDGTTIRDLFGENHREVFGGAVTVPGVIGEAMLFDGVDDAVFIPTNETIALSEKFTYEAWSNHSVNDGNAGIISKGTWNGFAALEMGGGGQFKIRINGGGNSQGFWGDFSPGKWYHLVMTVDGRGPDKFLLYVNGKVQEPTLDSTGQTGDLSTAPEGMWFGFEERNVIFYTGMIDEPRIYNRALTPEEVVLNYESRGGIAVDYTSDKLISVWGKLKSE